MKRYLLFCWLGDGPKGGANDFLGDYDTREDAIEAGKAAHSGRVFKYFHVFDSVDRRCVYRNE